MHSVIAAIVAEDVSHRDIELDLAVEVAAEVASYRRCGILITRHDFSTFTVAVTPDVPFGLIHELDLAA
jgi:hypothetical protein